MDGDILRMKQHDVNARFATRTGMSRRGAADRFRQAGAPSAARGGDASSHATGRPRMSTYLDYGYTESPFQGGPLQGNELQPYPPTLRDQQQRQQQPSVHQPLASYDSEMVYDLSGQQGPTQATYEVVPPPYSARQSAAMEALSSQFGVPQYFPPNEPTGTGVPAVGPPYLPSTVPLSAYNPPPPGGMGRSSVTHFYQANMAGLTSIGPGERMEQQQQQQQQQPSPPPPPQQQHQQQQPQQPQPPPSQQPQQQLQQIPRTDFQSANVREVYAQFQCAVQGTFDNTRAGRLVEASRSLLEISEWLVTNARELGVLRDEQTFYADRLQLWNDFNICWLALCQKQKDMAEELFQTGRQPPQTSLLSNEAMDNLGKELIQLCDRMEQHGLVDYQLGIWEEEILSVLGQCLDIVEDRLDFFRSHAVTVASR